MATGDYYPYPYPGVFPVTGTKPNYVPFALDQSEIEDSKQSLDAMIILIRACDKLRAENEELKAENARLKELIENQA